MNILSTQIVVLSNQAKGTGFLWSGILKVPLKEEPLAVATLRELRRRGIDIKAGDLLFFPLAAPGHRMIMVGDEREQILREWDRISTLPKDR